MHDDANLVANSSTIPSSPRESLAALQDTLVNGTELDQRVGYGLDHRGWKENRERERERERRIEQWRWRRQLVGGEGRGRATLQID